MMEAGKKNEAASPDVGDNQGGGKWHLEAMPIGHVNLL